jgi:hypothetical protein
LDFRGENSVYTHFSGGEISVYTHFSGGKTEYAISDLASEFSGQFIFAKIDIDEQEELKQQFSITNVPTLIVFKDGKEVQREEGELQAQELRILLKHYGVFRESDHRREQAREKHIAGDKMRNSCACNSPSSRCTSLPSLNTTSVEEKNT